MGSEFIYVHVNQKQFYVWKFLTFFLVCFCEKYYSSFPSSAYYEGSTWLGFYPKVCYDNE